MVDFVAVVEKLIKWLMDRHVKQTAEIAACIETIQSACRALARVDDPSSDEAIRLHEGVKQMYELATSRLPSEFLDGHGGDLYRALSSARIYYWLRVIDDKSDDELERLFQDRRTNSTSFEHVKQLITAAYDSEGGRTIRDRIDLAILRRECLHDIERLVHLRPVGV